LCNDLDKNFHRKLGKHSGELPRRKKAKKKREVVQYITAVFLMSLTQVLSLTLVFQAVLLSKMHKFRSCFPAYNVDFLN